MKDLKSVLEGILGDIDDTLVDSDNAVKQIARTKALAGMNIPTIDSLHHDRGGGLYFCWDLPASILNMIKPHIADCVNTIEKKAGSWFKDWITRGACRIKMSCNGKVLSLKLIPNDSADGTVFFRLQGKDYYTFGRTNKETFALMLRITEQLALHPDILVEMVKNPSTRSKDTQKVYDKLMAAE